MKQKEKCPNCGREWNPETICKCEIHRTEEQIMNDEMYD